MTRRRSPPTSAAIEAQIRELEERRRAVEIAEDQRRGELVREYLAGGSGDALRSLLDPLIAPRDRYLFGMDRATSGRANEGTQEP